METRWLSMSKTAPNLVLAHSVHPAIDKKHCRDALLGKYHVAK